MGIVVSSVVVGNVVCCVCVCAARGARATQCIHGWMRMCRGCRVTRPSIWKCDLVNDEREEMRAPHRAGAEPVEVDA